METRHHCTSGEYARAQALTAPDETVLWAGLPEPAGCAARSALPDAAAGALLLVAAGALAAMIFGRPGADAAAHPLGLTLLVCLSVAGALLAAAPLARAREARATLYVVTDRRVLVCRTGAGRRPAFVEQLAPLPSVPRGGE